MLLAALLVAIGGTQKIATMAQTAGYGFWCNVVCRNLIERGTQRKIQYGSTVSQSGSRSSRTVSSEQEAERRVLHISEGLSLRQSGGVRGR